MLFYARLRFFFRQQFPLSLSTTTNTCRLELSTSRWQTSIAMRMSSATEDKTSLAKGEEQEEINDSGESDNEESGEDGEHEEANRKGKKQVLSAEQKDKRMKRAKEAVNHLTGSTHSNADVISTIMAAQNRVFGPLRLEELGPEEKKRTRTHVNPLSKQFLEVSFPEGSFKGETDMQQPTNSPSDWKEWYDDPTKPLGIDVGCAAGRFALLMASGLADNTVPEEFRPINHLGVEIRRPLVERGNLWAKGKNLDRRIKFVAASANISLKSLIAGYSGPIKFIAVQFPDPHFKRKHHKRRVVNDSFIKMVSEILPPNSYFFVQSDVEEAAAQMRDRIDGFPSEFQRVGEYTPRDSLLKAERVRSGEGEEYWTRDGKRALEGGKDYGDWKIGPNPMGVPTEREVQNEALGLPIYRALFRKL